MWMQKLVEEVAAPGVPFVCVQLKGACAAVGGEDISEIAAAALRPRKQRLSEDVHRCKKRDGRIQRWGGWEENRAARSIGWIQGRAGAVLACCSLCSFVDSALNSLAQRVVKLLLPLLADPHLLYVRELIVDARPYAL